MAALSSCALDDADRSKQRTRYRQLAATVACLDRRSEAILVEFDEDLDRKTLARTLAVERECCPFFGFEFDEPTRRLLISVREPDQLPALEAMAAVLGSPSKP